MGCIPSKHKQPVPQVAKVKQVHTLYLPTSILGDQMSVSCCKTFCVSKYRDQKYALKVFDKPSLPESSPLQAIYQNHSYLPDNIIPRLIAFLDCGKHWIICTKYLTTQLINRMDRFMCLKLGKSDFEAIVASIARKIITTLVAGEGLKAASTSLYSNANDLDFNPHIRPDKIIILPEERCAQIAPMANPKRVKFIREFNTAICSLPPVSVTFISPNIKNLTQQGSILMGDKTIYDDPEASNSKKPTLTPGDIEQNKAQQSSSKEKSLVWSVGICLLNFLTPEPFPFTAKDFARIDHLGQIINKTIEDLYYLSEDCKDFLKKALNVRKSQRGNFETLLCHQWLHPGNNFNSLESKAELEQISLRIQDKLKEELMRQHVRNVTLNLLGENFTNNEIKQLIQHFIEEGAGKTTCNDILTAIKTVFNPQKDKIAEIYDRSINNTEFPSFLGIHLNIPEILTTVLAYKDTVYSLFATAVAGRPGKLTGQQFALELKQELHQKGQVDEEVLKCIQQLEQLFGELPMSPSNISQVLNFLGLPLFKLREITQLTVPKGEIDPKTTGKA